MKCIITRVEAFSKAELTSNDELTLKLDGESEAVSPFKSIVYPEKILLIEFDVLLTVTPSTTSSASDAACFWDVLGVPAIVGSARKSFNAESPVVILIALSAPIGDFTTKEYTPADVCSTDAEIPDKAFREEASP